MKFVPQLTDRNYQIELNFVS